MSKNKVYQGQNFIDKVLESTGSSDNAFEMSILNGISLTNSLAIGQELQASKVTKKAVVRIFTQKRPASALRNNFDAVAENEGIGYMAIESDFIVK